MIYFKAVLVLAVIYIVLQVLYSGFSSIKAMSLTKRIYVEDRILGKGSDYHMFVAGDSVGAGVGASSFEKSVVGRVAGKIAEDHKVYLTNKSVSGYKIQDVLNVSSPPEKQDLILLIVSSNNLYHFTDLKKFQNDTKSVLNKFSPQSKKVIIVGPGRVFDAAAIPFFIRPFYKMQSARYVEILKEESEKIENVQYVNPTATEISYAKYGPTSASDNFHPNNEGHRFWFDLINERL